MSTGGEALPIHKNAVTDFTELDQEELKLLLDVNLDGKHQ